jgi:endo-1,4-beta-xylanase
MNQAAIRSGRPTHGAMPSRRAVLAGALALGGLPVRALAVPTPPPWTVPYGSAVAPDPLANDPAYRAAVLRWCAVVTPEGGLKWADVRPTRDAYSFTMADAYLRFATDHGLRARGHTLVWADAMPDWTRSILQAEAEAILVDYIRTVVGRYKGRIWNWDVVNEPMAPDATSVGTLRPSMWLAHLGPRYIDIAFRTAAAADPHAKLVLNDYDIGYATAGSRLKRDGLLALVKGMVDRGIPLHAVGLQGHLHGERPIDREGLSRFVASVKALGLDVIVTELDVIDDKLPGAPSERDRMAAAQVDAYLGGIFDAARPLAVLTWGICDRYTWVPRWYKRADGLPNRPLPLDADDRPKPLMGVIERYCR